jgi:predicted DNA binding CopG/RHH family protein
MEMCDSVSDVAYHSKSIFGENQEVRKLPEKIRKKLKREARAWDASIAHERREEIQENLNKAEPFFATRPPRRPVSLRIDPFDLSMLKRIARRKGIPFTQLMSMWLHEKIEQEKVEPNF